MPALQHWFSIHPTFSAAFGAAAGGFAGVLVFFFVRLAVERYMARARTVREYLCVTPLNSGQQGETKGELEHHRGVIVEKEGDLRDLGVSHPVWEWKRTPTAAGNGQCLFFGPYAMDASIPAVYTASFRIRGFGFRKPTEVRQDWLLLKLDVLRKLRDMAILPATSGTGTVIAYDRYDTLAKMHVQVSHLARGGWQEYELTFPSDGRGELEYRCFAFDGTSAEFPDNFTNCGAVRIFFDRVVVKRLAAFRLPPV